MVVESLRNSKIWRDDEIAAPESRAHHNLRQFLCTDAQEAAVERATEGQALRTPDEFLRRWAWENASCPGGRKRECHRELQRTCGLCENSPRLQRAREAEVCSPLPNLHHLNAEVAFLPLALRCQSGQRGLQRQRQAGAITERQPHRAACFPKRCRNPRLLFIE